MIKEIYQDIIAFYSDPERPSYSKISDSYEKGIPSLLLEKLNDRYWIKEGTDINSDAGFFVSLLSESELFLFIYSFVTDAFHIIEIQKSSKFDSEPSYKALGHLTEGDELVQYCQRYLPENVIYLDRQKLEQTVEFNWNAEGFSDVPLYKVLFLQEGSMPYFD